MGVFDSDNTRVVNPRILRFENKVSLPTPFERAQALHEANLTYIEPATPKSTTGYLYQLDSARKKYETELWVQLKKALEDATNLMMLSIIDPRYAALGFGAGQVLRAAGSTVGAAVRAGRNLYKTYKLSRAIRPSTLAVTNLGKSNMSSFFNFFKRPIKPEVPSSEIEYIDAFLNGTKPMYAVTSKGYGSQGFLEIEKLLNGHKYIELERPWSGGMLTIRYYINEPKLKQTIAAYKDLYKSRLGLRTDNIDDIYNHLINNPKLLDLNILSGTTGLQDIIGLSLGYGPKDAIMFKLGATGLYEGEVIPAHFVESLKTYEYDKLVPGVYNILKKNIERGTLVGKRVTHNGSHIGFGYSPKTFIDDYGRKVVATPWKGTDLLLTSYIPEYLKVVLSHYWSPEKKLQVMQSMGWGEKEYSEFLNELLRSLGTVAKGEVKGPKDGFTIIALHKGQAVGIGSNMEGRHVMTFNRERIPDKQTAIESVLHELGGHGKTMSIDPGKSTNISEAFPRITLLMLKNEEIANNTLLLNQKGKFWSLFPTSDKLEIFLYNLEKKTGKKISSKGTQNLFNQRRYYLYNNSTLEKMTRGYVGLLMEKLGYNKTMNLELLKRYFTPESVEKFKNSVLNFGTPIVGGYTLYNLK